ncbi:hypothetical protein MG295_00166 [Bacillus phage vB_BcgM]|nr:hypothetical protein MG295_00166 [Bacillus phage vB_BcgM]
MANITITYDYENPARVNEVVDVLVALGELNYCVEKRNEKGSLSLKKVHQEVVSIDRIAEQLEEVGYTSKHLSFPDQPIILAPMPQVHRIGQDYIVAYSKYDAIRHISNWEDKTYSEKEKEYRVECVPLTSHEALFDTDVIGKKFGELLSERYPAGVPTEWIEGGAYYRLPFSLVIENMHNTEPRFLAHLDKIKGTERVFYRTYISKKVEEYLSGEGE